MRTHRSRSLTELGSFGLISLMRNAYAPVSQAPRSVWTTQESLTRMLAVGVVRLMGLACQIEQLTGMHKATNRPIFAAPLSRPG